MDRGLLEVVAEIDGEADAAYVRISSEKVARPEIPTNSVLVDLDNVGMVVGIEILGLATSVPLDDIIRQFHIHSDKTDIIRQALPTIRGTWTVQTAVDSTVVQHDQPLAHC